MEQTSTSHGSRQLVVRIGKEVTNTIKDMFRTTEGSFAKWRVWEEGVDGADAWDFIWEDRTYPMEFHLHVQRHTHKRLNHFSRAINALTRKDDLCGNIRLFKAAYQCGPLYSFAPRSFVVPKERKQLCAFAKRLNNIADESEAMEKMFIFKPASANRGKGIYVFNRLQDLVQDRTTPIGVVQRYVQYPCLIDGYKFDLRLYVLLADAWPPEIYLHKRGLVRISSQRYDVAQFTNPFQHLTNSSVTKTSKQLEQNSGEAGEEQGEEGKDAVVKPEDGWKWSLPQLWEYLADHELYGKTFDKERLWREIEDLVLLTVLPLVGKVPHEGYGYELFGFDVLLDAKLKCWLMEVNRSPAMRVFWPADKQCKTPMVHDLFRMLRINELDASIPLNHTTEDTKDDRKNNKKPPSKFCAPKAKAKAKPTAAPQATASGEDADSKQDPPVYTRQEHNIDQESLGLFKRLFPFDAATERLAAGLKRHKFEYGDKLPPNSVTKPFITQVLEQLKARQ
jgi:hypothetical protein